MASKPGSQIGAGDAASRIAENLVWIRLHPDRELEEFLREKFKQKRREAPHDLSHRGALERVSWMLITYERPVTSSGMGHQRQRNVL